MIPRAHITAWRTNAPWPENEQVEQDLIVSRALVELFSDSVVADGLAFCGGTALHKLFVALPCRYSEDIDLVQLRAGSIGPLPDAIRERLDPWLGTPRYKRSRGRVTLGYRYHCTFEPVQRMRLKVEINAREHFSVLGIAKHVYEVRSPWFSGSAPITTYQRSMSCSARSCGPCTSAGKAGISRNRRARALSAHSRSDLRPRELSKARLEAMADEDGTLSHCPDSAPDLGR